MYPARKDCRLVFQAAADAPPRWAVVVVKICVIGLLLLPISPLLWLVLYGPRGDVGYRPLAFLVTAGLWVGMWFTAAYITTTYPPVRPREKR